MLRTLFNLLKTVFGSVFLPISFFLIAFLVAIEWDVIERSIRYDKYPIYMDLHRASLMVLVLGSGLYIYNRFVFPFFCGMFFPTNLFLVLFLSMVLPGVLLTSGNDVPGITSFYSFLAAFLCFVFGAYFASLLLRFDARRELASYQKIPVESYFLNGAGYWIMLVLLFGSLGLSLQSSGLTESSVRYAIEFLMTGNMPENARSVAEQRLAAYSDEGYREAPSVVNAYLMGLVLPLASMFIFLNGYIRKNKYELILGAVLAILVFFLLVSGGSRLRGMFYILFVFVVLSHVRQLKLKTVASWAVLVLGLLVLQTIALGRMVGGEGYLTNIVMSLNRVIERIILVKGYVTQQVFSYIPWHSDFRYGETYLTSLMGTLDKKMLLAEEMSQFIYGGVGGTAGPQAFGEAYANFGVMGMLIVAALLGMVMQTVTAVILRQPRRDVLTAVFSAYAIVLLARVGYGDLFTFKSNGMHVLLLLWVAFIVAKLMGWSWTGSGGKSMRKEIRVEG